MAVVTDKGAAVVLVRDLAHEPRLRVLRDRDLVCRDGCGAEQRGLVATREPAKVVEPLSVDLRSDARDIRHEPCAFGWRVLEVRPLVGVVPETACFRQRPARLVGVYPRSRAPDVCPAASLFPCRPG